jgi:O-antigen ligase
MYARPWFDFSYWALAYLSTFVVVESYMSDSPTPERALVLNRLSWSLAIGVLVFIVYVARQQLFADTAQGRTGYGITVRITSIAGAPMVRESGISRLAAVPAIISFVYLWRSNWILRLAVLPIFGSSTYLIWMMQSRGSLTSFALAIALMMVLMSRRARVIGAILSSLVALVTIAGYIPNSVLHQLYIHATRGEGTQGFASMSGRTIIFREAWEAILAAPFLGYGPQADHHFMAIGNAQNGLVYALLCSGVVGAWGYLGGLVVGWVFLVQALRKREVLPIKHETALLQIAGIMAFFTMRSYPENCAAVFSVDLLVQLPALVYLGEIVRSVPVVKASVTSVTWAARTPVVA